MATVAQAPSPVPVRHGTCRLVLVIDTGCTPVHYRVARVAGGGNQSKTWRLRAIDGPRAGAVYLVTKHRRVISCSCPDASLNGAACKHVRALLAVGLLSGSHARLAVEANGGEQ
jgi:SWIM zinc finger